MAFPLTARLVQLVTSTPCKTTTIQLMPAGDSIACYEQDDNCEIGITKKGYLQLFSEGHTYFEHAIARGATDDVAAMDQQDLEHLHLATLALLTTTNEHTTAWRLHEAVVAERLRRLPASRVLEDEYAYVTALAASRLPKINKSSVLWTWLRKLALLAVFREFHEDRLVRFVATCLRSMEVHFANYSAGFTLLWALTAASTHKAYTPGLFLGLVRTQCRQTLTDVSLWHVFGLLLRGHPLRRLLESYNVLCADVRERFGVEIACLKAADLPSVGFALEAAEELQWLLKVNCKIRTPYVQVLSAIDRNTALAILRQQDPGADVAFADIVQSVEAHLSQPNAQT